MEELLYKNKLAEAQKHFDSALEYERKLRKEKTNLRKLEKEIFNAQHQELVSHYPNIFFLKNNYFGDIATKIKVEDHLNILSIFQKPKDLLCCMLISRDIVPESKGSNYLVSEFGSDFSISLIDDESMYYLENKFSRTEYDEAYKCFASALDKFLQLFGDRITCCLTR